MKNEKSFTIRFVNSICHEVSSASRVESSNFNLLALCPVLKFGPAFKLTMSTSEENTLLGEIRNGERHLVVCSVQTMHLNEN